MPENRQEKLKLLDLFSGILVGGFSLGLERSGGFDTVAFCEIEDFPRRVLAKHWPEVPCYHDIRELTAARLAADGIAVDAISAGWPCQDNSVAGKRAGINRGERSSLIWETIRLIGELRPEVVFLENVTGFLSIADSYSEYSVDCVCGWSCRWGGDHLRDGADAFGVRQAQLQCASVSGDGDKGGAFADEDADAVWWDYQDPITLQSEALGSDDLGSSYQASVAVSGGNIALPDRQERSVPLGDFRLPVDGGQAGRFRGSGEPYQATDTRAEQDGQARGSSERLVCPCCGRAVDYATARPCKSSGMGDVFRALAALGYHVEWSCIRAARVGLPHNRDRFWAVAYPRQKRVEGVFLKTLSRFPALSGSENLRRAEDWAGRPDLSASGLCRSYHGIPNGVDRTSACGNAVVPALTELLGRAWMEASA